MRIMPVNNCNMCYGKKIERQKSNQVSFNGYREVFKECLNKSVGCKADMENIFTKLLESAKDEYGVRLHKGFSVVGYSDTIDLHNKLWCLKEASKKYGVFENEGYSTLISKDGATILAQDGDSLIFRTGEHPRGFEFTLDSSSDIVMERPYDRIKVYNMSGRLKEVKKYSSDYSDSSTHCYNKDGSENSLKSFFKGLGF